ncbi:MAG: c-type cytochrome [Devosia sp.]|uniref:c-type cytochrome n=1 Tax=Devosia sp. TaxID=1871048 RepID=UPI001AD523B2|nr:c-type cytochrome [Devosia sp.]MBN9309922.1 c-type cytochrome [Devosia sp.]MBN9316648.1 c-type cytochrome [Devosia sp.]
MSLRKPLALLLVAGALAATSVAIAANAPAGAGGAAAAALPANADLSKIEGIPELEGADIVRGKRMFSSAGGNCLSCHGWDGDGTGKNPRSEGAAALLRESGLDAAGFIQIISCGIPGTPMPYHDSQAYKDDRCYGMVAADFEAGQEPHKGKSIKKDDIVNLVAYIMTSIQGKPKATYEDCVAWFEKSAEKACAFMKQ